MRRGVRIDPEDQFAPQRGEPNAKLYAVADANGRPMNIFMTVGQVSEYMGAAALLQVLPNAEWLLEDGGYDAVWYREALKGVWKGPASHGRRTGRR